MHQGEENSAANCLIMTVWQFDGIVDTRLYKGRVELRLLM